MNRRIPRRHAAAIWLVFAAISLLVYSRAFDNDFRQDDFVFLKHAETACWLDSCRPSDDFAFFRPGSLILFRIEHLIFGRNGGAYIAANFAFHCLISILMLLVLGKISPVPDSAPTAAGLFLLGLFHYGKEVMWACCSGPLVSIALSLAGMLLALRWAGCGTAGDRSGETKGRGRSLFIAIALMTAAPLFHEAAIVTPVVTLLAAAACHRAGRLRSPGAAALLLLPVVLFLVSFFALYAAHPDRGLAAVSLYRIPERLVRYSGFAIVPIQRTVIVDAPPLLQRLIGISPRLQIAVGALLLAALGYLAAAGKSGARILSAWFPAAIIPFTLIELPDNWLQLRYLYYAAIPLCGLAAAGWHGLFFNRRIALRAVAVILLTLAVLGTSTLVILLERHYGDFPGA